MKTQHNTLAVKNKKLAYIEMMRSSAGANIYVIDKEGLTEQRLARRKAGKRKSTTSGVASIISGLVNR